jgi:hypothetical protein
VSHAGVHAPADIRTFGQPYLPRSSNSKHKDATVFSVIREIEIWRVAMLMVNRYADEAEANSFQRAEELRPKGESRRSAPKLAAEGDHAGAAIWRRIIVAIEQLTVQIPTKSPTDSEMMSPGDTR